MPSLNRILIVDDHPINVLGLEELLQDDYQVASTQSGEEALSVASTFCPDIILLDIMMPGIDGYETCRRLREFPQLQHTKIMMVSAKAMANERLQGYEAGADDYVTKPFDNDELRAKIRVYLRLKSVEEVDQLKSDVLKLLQHETRTPLNGIIGPAQIMREDAEMDVEERTMMLDMVLTSADRLHTLLDRVVTLAAMKGGSYQWHKVRIDLGDVVRSAVCRVTGYAGAQQVKIEQKLSDPPLLFIDIERVDETLRALLENAIRFSPIGGRVVICIDHHQEHVYVMVTDQGGGITPAFLPSS